MTRTPPVAPYRGQIILVALVFFGIFVSVTTAFIGFLLSGEREVRLAIASTQALQLAEAGVDKAMYQLNQNPNYTGETDTAVGNGTFTITVSILDGSTKLITTTGTVTVNGSTLATKTVRVRASIDTTVVSFHYGVQAGNGGFRLENSSSIRGNVFSSGPVIGTSANYIYGDVVSAGASGLVYGIHATSSVYAHTVGKAGKTTLIDKDAYYTTMVNTIVGGVSYPGSPDPDPVALPISDEQIDEWETEAVAGGIAPCVGGSYNIPSGNVTLGPIKVPCDLNISGTAVVTINGHIWVAGDIIVQNSAVIRMSPGFGAASVAIIADNPADRLTSSTIEAKNSATFQNSGTAGSFIFLISQNNSAEMGGSVEAFELSNSASAMVAYAAHGLIPIENSVSLKEVTAYKITMKNSAAVTYDSGLLSTVFQSGPGGSWAFVPGTYGIAP